MTDTSTNILYKNFRKPKPEIDIEQKILNLIDDIKEKYPLILKEEIRQALKNVVDIL